MLMIKILIGEDHVIFREALKQVLMKTNDMVVAAVAANGRDVLNKIRKDDFDVLVFNLAMSDRSGQDTLKKLKSQKLKLPIIVLGTHPEEQYALRLLRAGADGYITKKISPDDLITAIRTVYAGKKYISPYLAEKIAFGLDADMSKLPNELLSHREYHVMCRLAASIPTKVIADELSLTVKTISNDRTRILKKMRIRNNAELTHYAMQNHLVDLRIDSTLSINRDIL